MVVGFAADGRERNVIGVAASCTPAQTKAQVLDIAQKTSDLVGGRPITADDIVLKEEYAYPVYGVPSKETVEAIRLSARFGGHAVYEGKLMHGMIDLVQKGFFPKGSKVLLHPSRWCACAQRLQLHVSERMKPLHDSRRD